MITPEQEAAITAKDKLILVKAGAGTGKTEVLTRRILYLLEEHHELQIKNMAIITFTNKATENLQSRLKLYLYHQWKNATTPEARQRFRYELESLNSCYILTIHRFCKLILDIAGPTYYDDLAYSPTFKVSEQSLNLAIEDALEQWLIEQEKENNLVNHLSILPVHELKNIVIGTYNMIRSRGLNIRDVIKQSEENFIFEPGFFPRALKKELVGILKKVYTLHRKYRLKSLDTEDLLEYCYKILIRRPDVTKQVKEKFKYIFVDEFQDSATRF